MGSGAPDLVGASRELASRLDPGDLDETLIAITRAAVEMLPGVDMASITVRHADGRLETSAPTDEVLRGVDAAQHELREGPCYDASTDAVAVIAPWLAQDDRFPRYRKVALDAGIQAQAGIRLFEAPKSQGALNVYSYSPGAFENMGSLEELFTHQSGVALEYAREIDNLREAVQTRQLIGQGVGVVMERYELDDDRAFAFLIRLSNHSNTKLRDVAREIVDAARARAL